MNNIINIKNKKLNIVIILKILTLILVGPMVYN